MNHTLRSIYKSLLLVSVFLCLCVPARSAAPPSDFKVRAFYLDCRTQVMTVSAIKELASDLSKKEINTLLIEYEATFPFQKHATLCNQLAFSRSEVQDIVSYCTSLGIEVIPLQNCFGHCEYILRHDRYAHLREDSKEVSQVCPLKIEEAKKVFREIFREVAELHPSPYFHIGADETYLLGSCAQCSQVNKSRLFVDYIKAMCEVVKEMGKKPIIWADIILMHPEAVQELPKDLIYVDWNYGWEPDRFGKLDNLLKLGVKMWGAASLRSAPDNTYLTQWMKHFNNLATFLPFARAHGYEIFWKSPSAKTKPPVLVAEHRKTVSSNGINRHPCCTTWCVPLPIRGRVPSAMLVIRNLPSGRHACILMRPQHNRGA